MLIIWIITLTSLILYILKLIQYNTGWKKVIEFEPFNNPDKTFVSIIIPVRNEEDKIKRLLEDLLKQDYPKQLFEVILVNDHSGDLTIRKILPFCNDHHIFRLINLPVRSHGKKAAINAGAEESKGEIIVTTDADCRVGNKWISTIVSYYLNCNKPVMIIGLVDMVPGNSVFNKFQQFEFASLIASGAGAAGISRPVFCSGANLIYKRELYFKYSDPMNESIVSGDDTLFMLKVKKDFRYEIKLLKSKKAVVYTDPQSTVREFFQQRIRWTYKSKYYKDFDILSLAFIVLILNVSIIISFILLFTSGNYLLLPLLFGVKTVTDGIFLNKIFTFFNKRKLLRYLILFQIVYPLYISIIGISGNIISYKWKGREYG
jgi:cellulose synthase/poly-beta-1,6-N-acetylglucosamine synthase-like glycosyltransferase